MTDIHAVLLVPEKSDPHGLLKEGPCGARPPLAFLWRAVGRWLAMSPGDETIAPRALVLAWGGEPVAEGLDRANRVWVGRWCGYLIDWSVDDVREYGAALVIHLGGGTLVLLDAEGREVSDD